MASSLAVTFFTTVITSYSLSTSEDSTTYTVVVPGAENTVTLSVDGMITTATGGIATASLSTSMVTLSYPYTSTSIITLTPLTELSPPVSYSSPQSESSRTSATKSTTRTPNASATSALSTPLHPSSSLSDGAKAGIGVGVVLGVLTLATLIACLIHYKYRRRSGVALQPNPSQKRFEKPELDGNTHLSRMSKAVELEGSTVFPIKVIKRKEVAKPKAENTVIEKDAVHRELPTDNPSTPEP